MDQYKRLYENLRNVGGQKITIWQGIVKSVESITCTVTFGKQDVSGVRLRASEKENADNILITPKVGTAVTVGSLTGDYSQLVVLQIDQIETIIINGGKLGGLINIETLTEKINKLVDAFNSHTLASGAVAVAGSATNQSNPAPIQVPAIQQKADKLNKGDYEDEKIKH
ncbi:hypothetical protein [Phocaeicola faecicola]|uniref:hypothetical protein n=1 Tax=Phocaeicola faecicola TaxID=2739389 RepID=UPI0015E7E428|nr:hypothetical protein [Phocaeicola faecicola]